MCAHAWPHSLVRRFENPDFFSAEGKRRTRGFAASTHTHLGINTAAARARAPERGARSTDPRAPGREPRACSALTLPRGAAPAGDLKSAQVEGYLKAHMEKLVALARKLKA